MFWRAIHGPVLRINDHATGGRRTKDILGGPKGWGPKKKVANVEIYVIFEVFAFCGGRTKTDFKDRGSVFVKTQFQVRLRLPVAKGVGFPGALLLQQHSVSNFFETPYQYSILGFCIWTY